MLKRFIGDICKKAYTCTCVLPRNFTGASTQTFHTTASFGVLDKDVRSKKHVIRTGQEFKQESLPEDSGYTGELTESGITIPTEETHAMLIEGVRYDELPIAHIKATPNNTIISITDYTGTKKYAVHSCGSEGFKNVKKSTNVAAQATGLTIGGKVFRKGIRNLRVAVKGLGAGRLASMKGLQMAGLNIVSITDRTAIVHSGRRPRKAKRL